MANNAPFSNYVIEAADNLMGMCKDGHDEFDWNDCEYCEYYRSCEVLSIMDELQFMD